MRMLFIEQSFSSISETKSPQRVNFSFLSETPRKTNLFLVSPLQGVSDNYGIHFQLLTTQEKWVSKVFNKGREE